MVGEPSNLFGDSGYIISRRSAIFRAIGALTVAGHGLEFVTPPSATSLRIRLHMQFGGAVWRDFLGVYFQFSKFWILLSEMHHK